MPIGKGRIARAGKDVTIVSFSIGMVYALKAAEELAKGGIEAEVIDLRTIRPIDYASVVESVKKTNRLVVVEEAWPLGNISTEITYHVQKNAFDYLDAPVIRVNCEDVPVSYAGVLVEAALPNAKKIIKAVKDVLYIS